MNILDYIPFGKENAVKRDYLCAVTGLKDRKVRDLIEHQRRLGEVIINRQDGNGYYRSDEIEDIARQYRQNDSRAMSILVQQKHLRKKLKTAGYSIGKYGKITKEEKDVR